VAGSAALDLDPARPGARPPSGLAPERRTPVSSRRAVLANACWEVDAETSPRCVARAA